MTPPKKTPSRKAPAKKTATTKKTAARKPAKKAAAKKTTTKKAAPAKAPRVSARDRQVLELRRAGVFFDVIAEQLKFRDVEAAHASYLRALAGSLPPARDEAKRLELNRLDKLQSVLWPKALRGDMKAIEQLASIAQDRMRLVSTDPLPLDDEAGPIETAIAKECERLESAAPGLAAAALVLAREVDGSRGEPNAVATAARELRMTMSQLRGLAGTTRTPNPAGGDTEGGKGSGKGGTVTWLDELRQRSSGGRGSA